MARITDPDSWQYCETCESITLMSEWDYDARMCKECAKEVPE